MVHITKTKPSAKLNHLPNSITDNKIITRLRCFWGGRTQQKVL